MLHRTDLEKGTTQFVPLTEHPPLRLANIRLVGGSNVRTSFLKKLCRPYLLQPTPLQRILHRESPRLHFPDPNSPSSLREIVALSAKLADDLQRLDLFKQIEVSFMPSCPAEVPLDPLSSSMRAHTPASLEEIDVIVQLRENPRFWLKSSSDVGNGEGSVSLQGRIRNLFGGAERLEGSYEIGTRTKTALQLNLTVPIEASPDHAFALSFFSKERDRSFYASHFESLAGLKASINTNEPRRGVSHDLAWECVWRSLGRLSLNASMSMRKAKGDDIKSALVHTYVSDTRDQPLLGTEGSLLRSTTELASGWLGGERDHLRWEGESSISRSFASSSLSSLSRWPKWLNSSSHGYSIGARAGVIFPLPSPYPSFQPKGAMHPSDMFQLGGPTSLRMFAANSLGPKDGSDSLGGTVFWSLGTSVYAPLPKKEHWPLKLHAFLNAGQLVAPSASSSVSPPSSAWKQQAQTLARDLLLRPSSSAGFGLLYTQGPLRLELNAGMPLTAVRGDGARKGLQAGIGIDFLGG